MAWIDLAGERCFDQRRPPGRQENHTMPTEDLGPVWHTAQLNQVDDEIARNAFICGLKMLDPGVIERVVSGDETVCTKKNPKAFAKLRSLVKMHYALTDDSMASLGPEETAKILEKIRERLRKRYDIGGQA
jgi:hypothetical protein